MKILVQMPSHQNLTESQAETGWALSKFREEEIEQLGFQVNPPWLIDQFRPQYDRHRRYLRNRAEQARRFRAQERERLESARNHREELERKKQKAWEKRCAPPQRIIDGRFCKQIKGTPYWHLARDLVGRHWVLRPKAVLNQMQASLLKQGFIRLYTGWHNHVGTVERYVDFFYDKQDESMIWVCVATRRGTQAPPRRIL